MNDTSGRKHRSARLAANLTQEMLAGKINRTQHAVNDWENGRHSPQAESLNQLRRVRGSFDSTEDSEGGEASVSLFGEWLRGQREELKFTVAKLAQKAGLTNATIYNLESGRSKNPQEQTRKAIEEALGVRVPEDVEREVIEESSIANLGILQSFDPHSGNQWPECPGVYVLYDISERPIYIGRGRNIKERLRGHSTRAWFIRPIVENGEYIRIDDSDLRDQIERLMIKFLKNNAIINKQLVDRGRD